MKESFYDPKSSAKVPPKFCLCGYLHHLLFFLVFLEAWLSHLWIIPVEQWNMPWASYVQHQDGVFSQGIKVETCHNPVPRWLTWTGLCPLGEGVQNTLKSSETWVTFSLFPILLDPSTTKTSLSCRLYDCDPLPWASDDRREQQKDPKCRVKGSGCPEPAAATTVFFRLTSWGLPGEGNFVPITHLSSTVFS